MPSIQTQAPNQTTPLPFVRNGAGPLQPRVHQDNTGMYQQAEWVIARQRHQPIVPVDSIGVELHVLRQQHQPRVPPDNIGMVRRVRRVLLLQDVALPLTVLMRQSVRLLGGTGITVRVGVHHNPVPERLRRVRADNTGAELRV